MKLNQDNYLLSMLHGELADAVGREYVSGNAADRLGHSIDYYGIPDMWHDRGRENPKPDFIVHPGSAEEVAKVMKIATQNKIPVTPWGGGSGSQGDKVPPLGPNWFGWQVLTFGLIRVGIPRHKNKSDCLLTNTH